MICKKCRYDKCIAARMSRESADLQREGRRKVIDHYQRIEGYLNNRRRIMYTDAKMISVFTTMCECPLNYKEYAGNKRSDFIMLYDYAISIMQFDELDPPEKHILYRYVCGVDALLNSAYFTSRISFEDKWMVLNTCEYICVDPMPMTGDEPWAQHLFASSEDQAKYKSIVPQKVALWHSLIVPFHELGLEFDEFCVLKALICWHISHHKFGENGRRVCKAQRNLLINCLHDLAQERSTSPEEWVGNLILFISCVFQQMCELVNSLVMITFFDIVEYDAVVKEFFGFDT
ncbi:Ligand-binding domain of nuclear hormone receptor [Ancylostoma duodenale]|uniref:Ligand-binding domain of nuclear hormone receptor n=1 Tax=Ancylostoma duodenale TaxID=51022 RepID=A0A0C2CKE6_9BILA|nr:Ligand-binding domain of nuclear hormone receptor [Ancylostoma duodenale]